MSAMLKSRLFWAIGIVFVALIGLAWIAYSQEPESREAGATDLTEAAIAGYLAPRFSLQNTFGEEISLEEFRGRPVVLNFWATWCPPCRAEIPHLQDASTKYHGQAIILGVDQGEPLSVVADFAASYGMTYPLLLDTDAAVSRQYGVVALPQTFFIDADGVIKEVYTGIINRAILEDRIEKLLAEA